jgi:hypothetical protein
MLVASKRKLNSRGSLASARTLLLQLNQCYHILHKYFWYVFDAALTLATIGAFLVHYGDDLNQALGIWNTDRTTME